MMYGVLLVLLNACGRVADVMIFTFVSLMPVHNVCRICKIIHVVYGVLHHFIIIGVSGIFLSRK